MTWLTDEVGVRRMTHGEMSQMRQMDSGNGLPRVSGKNGPTARPRM